jgi:hypothetical protein
MLTVLILVALGLAIHALAQSIAAIMRQIDGE